jgi:Na+/H+-translocating membrane pyrophosphatase
MFRSIFNLGKKRNKIEAFYFYLIYLVLFLMSILVWSTILHAALNIYDPNIDQMKSFNIGQQVGRLYTIIILMVFSFLIVKAKNSLKEFSAIFFIFLSGIVGFYLSGLIGLMIVSFLTTRDKRR